MIIIYMGFAVFGGSATAVLVGQYDALFALVAAPFGGSLCALAAIPIALRGHSLAQ